MKVIGGDIYLTLDEIATACKLNRDSIRKMTNRGLAHWQYIKDPEHDLRTLILYRTMDFEYKDMLSDFYWQGLEPEQWLIYDKQRKDETGSGIISVIKTAYEDYTAYLTYYTDAQSTSQHKTNKARKYLAKAASCMQAIHIFYKENDLSLSNRKPIREASEYLNRYKAKLFPQGYGYMKCSERHIHEALKALSAGSAINEIISQPRMGNENRLGKDHSNIRGSVAKLLSTGKNPTIAEVVRKTKYWALREGYTEPSESTVRSMVAELKSINALERFGDKSKASHKYRFSIPTARAMNSGECWEMDGTRVQLQPFYAPDISSRNSGYQYLYIVAVRDVYSGAFLGWSFGVSESALMYREALKMAVTLTGYLPFEIRHDQFPGYNSDESEYLFETLTNRGVRITKTSKTTGKAHIERAFGTLQSVFEADRHTWIGQGITSSRDYARPTTKYLERVSSELKRQKFGWEEAWRQENEVFVSYNHTPVSLYSKKYASINQSPLQMHDTDAVNLEAARRVKAWDVADMFWATRRVSIRNHAVTIEVNRQRYTYMLTDMKHYDILRNHQTVLVRFDASDMSEVMLFDSLYRTFLNSVELFQPPQLYGPNPEYDKLAAEKAKQKAIKERMKAELEEIKSHGDPDILGISIGHMLPKEAQEAAENSAYAPYWRNTVPVPVGPQETKSKAAGKSKAQTPKPATVRKPDTGGFDYDEYIKNQL